MRRVAVGWLLVLTFVVPAYAADNPNDDPGETFEVEGLVVTADRRERPLKDTPEIISVITADEILRMHASSTSEVLETVAGVTLSSGTGSGFPKRGIVSINGVPAQYVLILVNGQRLLTDHIHTGQNVDLIPPEAILRIEIIKTAASAQYGSDAIGGVVNIITRAKSAEQVYKLYTSYGSNDSLNGGMRLATPVGESAWVTMFADWDHTAGPDILAPEHRIGKLGYDRVSVMNSLDVQIAPGLAAEVYFNYFQNRMDWLDGEVDSRLIMPKADIHLDLGSQWQVTGSLEYVSWSSDQGAELNELLSPQLFATWLSWGGRNQLSFGADTRFNWFQRTGLAETRTQWGFGLFAHDTVKLNSAWSASASVRMDQFEALHPVFSPKLAILYRPLPELGLRVALSRGFHAPTVQERYEQAYGHGGTALRFGNPDLEPETSTALSLSVEATPHRRLQLFANGYCHLVDNFIVPRYQGPWPEDPTKDMWVRTNILRAWIYGGEVSGRWSARRWLKLQLGYGYGANWDQAEEEQLQFDPGHSLFARIDLRIPFANHGHISLFTKALMRTGRSAWNWKPSPDAQAHDQSGYVTRLANYTLVDAGAEVTWRRASAFLALANLLSQNVEQLDDALTILDGQPLLKAGIRVQW